MTSKMLHLRCHTLRYSLWTSSAQWPFGEQLACSTFFSSCFLCSSSSVAKLKYTAKISLKSCFTACHQHTESTSSLFMAALNILSWLWMLFIETSQQNRRKDISQPSVCTHARTWTLWRSLVRADRVILCAFLLCWWWFRSLGSSSGSRRSFPRHWKGKNINHTYFAPLGHFSHTSLCQATVRLTAEI